MPICVQSDYTGGQIASHRIFKGSECIYEGFVAVGAQESLTCQTKSELNMSLHSFSLICIYCRQNGCILNNLSLLGIGEVGLERVK